MREEERRRTKGRRDMTTGMQVEESEVLLENIELCITWSCSVASEMHHLPI